MNITTGKINKPQKCLIYGPEGIGKSTFAAAFPDPIFIDTEDSTIRMDVARFDRPASWEMLKAQVVHVINNPTICKTLAIDTLDWAEVLCMNHLITVNNWKSIETPGYGKGFTELAEEWGRFLNMLSEVVNRGVNVVCTAHAQMRKFEQPDEMGAYDRWELKLQKKTAPITKEWADMVLFANYKTIVVTDAKTKSKKGQGGQRVMYTSHHPAWDAKNREGFPEELPFEFASIAQVFDQSAPVTEPTVAQSATVAPPAPEPTPEPAQTVAAPQAKPASSTLDVLYDGLPADLVQLMKASDVLPESLEQVCGPKSGHGRGYFPGGMKLKEYPADFHAHLVANWSEFLADVNTLNLPFDL